MSIRVDTVSLISGALVVGNRGLGVIGSAIPSTGQHGPGYIYNDLTLPADANKEYRGPIVTPPSAGTFFAYEDSSFDFTAPDGTYSFTYRLFEDGVDRSTAIGSITIGATVITAVGTAAGTSTASASGAATTAATGTANGTSTASAVGAAGTGTGSASGTSTAAATGASVASASGSAVGTSTANAVAFIATTISGAGSASGSSTALAISPNLNVGGGYDDDKKKRKKRKEVIVDGQRYNLTDDELDDLLTLKKKSEQKEEKAEEVKIEKVVTPKSKVVAKQVPVIPIDMTPLEFPTYDKFFKRKSYDEEEELELLMLL